MSSNVALVAEKVEQATGILDELGIDAWLTFVRASSECGDPVLPLILGQNLTWQSVLLIASGGGRVAIVGKYDDASVRSAGVWTEVIPYVESIRDPLLETLRRLDPSKLAINFSRDDVVADGLSHGLYLLLRDYLDGTPYADRLVSADAIIAALRSRKTPTEVARIRRAVAVTEDILAAAAAFAAPGRTEADVAIRIKRSAAERGAGLAWDAAQCPIVNSGPESMIGHGVPSERIRIEPGHVLHVDFGVRLDDYCSDLQRCWYVPRLAERSPPPAVARACDTVVRAIQAAAKTLKPGVEGWHVDAAARRIVADAGYPEYQHATGHGVGRSAHDGGAVLGPRWPRYGNTPMRKIEPGNVFTLELGIENVDGRGYIGLEEMVLVTDRGCEFLSVPQTELRLLT